MIDYQSTLLGRTEVAEDTMAFQFEKPNDFVFNAGQYIDLALLGSQSEPQNEPTHTFSIASSPSEQKLVVTTRMRNTVFKRALSMVPIGSGARITGPMGSFNLQIQGFVLFRSSRARIRITEVGRGRPDTSAGKCYSRTWESCEVRSIT
jgi:ferredoxin-NADP reductase